MARHVVGLFPDRSAAERALTDLKAAGFNAESMGVVMRDQHEAQAVAAEHGLDSTAGAVTGSIIGGGIGTLLAATGTFVIPGIGPFISGGILTTALVGGAAGWLVGGLAGLGVPRDEAEYYESRVEQGGVLVTVNPEGRDAEARQILLRDGAEDLRARGTGATPTDTATTTTPTPPMPPTAGNLAGTTPLSPSNPVPQRSAEMARDDMNLDRNANEGMDADDVTVNDQPLAPNSERIIGEGRATSEQRPLGRGSDRGDGRMASNATDVDEDVQMDPAAERQIPMTDQDIIARGNAERRAQEQNLP